MDYSSIIEKKKNNKILTYDELKYMIDSYLNCDIKDDIMSKFIMLIYNNGLSEIETNYLTDIMIKSGDVVNLSKIDKPIVDKHSTGGIGDKITLIVSPIVAACGIVVPKMSGRGLGITGGTADKLESIPGYKLDYNKNEFISLLEKHSIAVISQSDTLAIADKKIYALRNEIGAVDSIPLIASSIMSKKIASGADNIVIDLKVGNGAFMKSTKEATILAKTMIKIGKYYNKRVVCVLSDMSVPLGKYIGNALEVKEAIDFFDGIYDKRLYNLSVYISALMISTAKKTTLKAAKKEVLEVISKKQARTKFYEWIKAQNGDVSKFKINAKKYIVTSNESGYVKEIDASLIGQLVFELGAGRKKKTDSIDYSVGYVINKSVGNKVLKGDILGIIYYNKEVNNMEEKVRNAYKITKSKRRVKNIIIKTIK